VVVVRVTVSQLLATDLALDKLGARGNSAGEVRQLIGNDHVVASNPRGGGQSGTRRLLLGVTDGGRAPTIVVERTVDPTTWLIVTGRNSTAVERNLRGRR
jgi:hypothetical protein